MGKSSTQDIIRALIKLLAKGPKSINDISEETGFDRISITKYLETLKEAGVISETYKEEDARKRIFDLTCSFREDTYFGIPIDDKQNRLIDSIYNKIRKYWFEKTKRLPVQIQVQKTLYKVNKECGLKLPLGWYIFGALCVKPYNPSYDYQFYELPKGVESCIKNVVNEYAKDEFAYQTKNRQYKEEGKQLYLVKEVVLMLLYSGNFSTKSRSILIKYLKDLFILAPHPVDTTYSEILMEYPDLINELMIQFDDKKLKELQPEITGSFEDIWKLIALYNYKTDLESFYLKEVLDKYFRIEVLQQERCIVERCSYLQSLILPEEEPKDQIYTQLRNALEKVKRLSEEEKKSREEDLHKIRKEKGEESAQKHLLKKAGLA